MSDNVLILDIETIKDPRIIPFGYEDDKWPPPIGWQIVAVGLLAATRSSAGYSIEKLTCGSGDERTLLEQFWPFFEKRLPLLVTWNGRSFDMPVMLHRAMLHNVPAKGWFDRGRTASYNYRYSPDGHCDLLEQFTDYGATGKVKLDLISSMLGFAGKSGVDGSQVASMFEAGQIKEICDYCEGDILNLYGVFLRWCHLTGRLSTSGFQFSVDNLVGFLRINQQVKPHLEAFLNSSSTLMNMQPKYHDLQ